MRIFHLLFSHLWKKTFNVNAPTPFPGPVLHFSVMSLLGSSSIAMWQFLHVHNFVILCFFTEVLRGLLQKVENSVKWSKFNYCCWSSGYPSDANFLNSTADLFSWSPVTQWVSQGDRQKKKNLGLRDAQIKLFLFFFFFFCEGTKVLLSAQI